MPNTTLVFKPDCMTGSAEIEASGVHLSEQEMRELRDEIKKRYSRFVSELTGTTAFSTRLWEFPHDAQFRFTVRNPGDRSPDVVFESLSQPNGRQPNMIGRSGDVPDEICNALASERFGQPRAASDWSAAFFADLERLFSKQALASLNEADRHELRFVVDELRAVASQCPRDLTPLLLAGYVSLGERMALEHDPQRIGIYVLAARGIDQLFESLLPKQRVHNGSRDATVDRAEQASRAIRVTQMTRILARCLGLPEDWEV